MFAGLQLTFVTTFYADPHMCVSKVDNESTFSFTARCLYVGYVACRNMRAGYKLD